MLAVASFDVPVLGSAGDDAKPDEPSEQECCVVINGKAYTLTSKGGKYKYREYEPITGTTIVAISGDVPSTGCLRWSGDAKLLTPPGGPWPVEFSYDIPTGLWLDGGTPIVPPTGDPAPYKLKEEFNDGQYDYRFIDILDYDNTERGARRHEVYYVVNVTTGAVEISEAGRLEVGGSWRKEEEKEGCCGGEGCSSSGCPAGGPANGSFLLQYSLGRNSPNEPAGYVQAEADTWSTALLEPSSLKAYGKIGSATYSGGTAPTTLSTSYSSLTIVDDPSGTPQTYRLEFRLAGQTQPHRTVTVSSPATDQINVIERQYDATGATLLKTVTNRFIYTDLGSGQHSWKLTRALGTAEETREEVVKYAPVGGLRVERRIIRNASDTAVAVEEWAYQTFGDNEELVEWVRDPDGAALTRAWAYYDDPNDPGRYGRMKSYVSETGYWEHYSYDDSGEPTRTIKQLGANPFDDSDLQLLADNNIAELTDEFFDVELGHADFPGAALTRRRTLVEGVAASASYEIDWFAAEPGTPSAATDYTEVWRITSGNADPESGYASTTAFLQALVNSSTHLGHRVEKEYRYEPGHAQQYKIAKIGHPDGSVTEHGYPSATRTVTIEGFAGDRTRTTVEVYAPNDESFRLVEKETSPGAFTAISLVKVADRDEFGRVLETSYYFGAQAVTEAASPGAGAESYVESQTYGCCEVETRTNRAGLVTSYAYDNLHRKTLEIDPAGVKTHYEYDAAGRVTKITREGTDATSIVLAERTYDLAGRLVSTENGEGELTFHTYRRVTPSGSAYGGSGTFYWEQRTYPHASGLGPVAVTWADSRDQIVRSWAASTLSSWSGSSPPTGSESLTQLTRETTAYDWAGRVTSTRRYFDLTGLSLSDAGTEGTHYAQTTDEYDALGQRTVAIDEIGDRVKTVYDSGGRAIETRRGTSPSNLELVSETFYDLNRDRAGTDFRAYATRTTRLRPSSTIAYTHTDFERSYDTANERVVVWTKPAPDSGGGADAPWIKEVFDYQGNPVESSRYTSGSTTNLLTKTTSDYDAQAGRLTTNRVFEVLSGAATSNKIETTYRYDSAGRLFSAATTGRGIQKTLFDAHGRSKIALLATTDGASTTSVSDDVVVEEMINHYDDADRPIQTDRYERLPSAGAMATGLLSSTPSLARVSYAATWYDDGGRMTHEAEYGDNGGVALVRPATPPEPDTSSSRYVVKNTYDEAGRIKDIVVPPGRIERRYYDALGRTIKVIDNYMDGTAGSASDQDRTTLSSYSADGQLATVTAVMPGGTNGVTTYTYGDGGSPVPTNSLLERVVYPDGDTSSDNIQMTYYADGTQASRTDQRGVVIEYTYDDTGRLVEQDVMTAPMSVGGDRRMTYSYTDLGQLETVTTYNGSASVTSEVLHEYDGYGALAQQHQAHGGSVSVGTTPSVAYDRDAAIGNRLVSLTYPNGRMLAYGYGNVVDSGLSRSTVISDGSQDLVAYGYLGENRSTSLNYPEPQVALTQTLTRFGRVGEHLWQQLVVPTTLDNVAYTYPRAEIQTYRNDKLAPSPGEDDLYGYDDLLRLDEVRHLGGGILGQRYHLAVGLDAVGNWSSVAENVDGTGPVELNQTRTHNTANEITGITGGSWAQPLHDEAGNATRMPKPAAPTQGFDATYDPWNRLVKLVDTSTSQTVAEYAYDGLGWRIVQKLYSGGVLIQTRHAYYSEQWQLLEERVGGTAASDVREQHVWGVRYMDDLVCRDRDTNSDGTLDERLYALQDDRFNVTVLVNTSGVAIERFRYFPHGARRVLDANFAADADGLSDYGWRTGHQGLFHDPESGLIYNRARMLHPTLGRFTQRDPLGYVDGTNLYAAYHVMTFDLDPFGTKRFKVRRVSGESDSNSLSGVDRGYFTDAHWLVVASSTVGETSVSGYASALYLSVSNITGNPGGAEGIDASASVKFTCNDKCNIVGASDGEAKATGAVSAGVSLQVSGGDGTGKVATVNISAIGAYKGQVRYIGKGVVNTGVMQGGLDVNLEPGSGSVSLSKSATFECYEAP